jgi:adenylate kinase family enzyme
MNNFEPAYEEIEKNHPKLIYLSGKTSTGKTTLANSLQDKYKVAVIELDQIIHDIKAQRAIDKFIAIYRHRDEVELIELFVDRVKQEINKALRNHTLVVFEGAIANSETLYEIVQEWLDDFLFIYLEPTDLEQYRARLLSRFMLATHNDRSGLPSGLWEGFRSEELEEFFSSRQITPELNNVITAYAKESMQESQARLKMFQSAFKDILVLEV